MKCIWTPTTAATSTKHFHPGRYKHPDSVKQRERERAREEDLRHKSSERTNILLLNFFRRQESEEKIWELVQKWIRKNGMFKDTRAKHVILFHLPPRYGYETIIQHVHRKSLNKWQVSWIKSYNFILCNVVIHDRFT